MFKINQKIFFSNLLLLCKLNIFWLECEKDEKTKVQFRTPLIQRLKKCNISFTYNLLKGCKINCELCLNFNEYT
jgi:hypothetical protein